MEGKEVPEYEAMMDRVGLDYKKILKSRKKDITKAKLLIEAILKAKDIYAAIAECYKYPVEFSGFERDVETKDFPGILKKAFGEELLQKALISKISYNPNLVNVRFNDDEYLLAKDKFQKWKSVVPEAGEFTYVGESLPSWNTDPDFGKVVIPTPIRFYSFENENPDEYKYLDDLKPEDKMRAYKLSNFSHEIAHHIFAYLMTAKKRGEWKKLVDKNTFVTRYVEETYVEDEELKHEESFTESVGLYIAVPGYLQRTHNGFYEFIQTNFPEIKSPHLFKSVENQA